MEILWAFDNFTLASLLDILLVTTVIFAVSWLIRSTQAVPLLRGTVIILIGIGLATTIIQLTALRWLFEQILLATAVGIPIIFQPELRRALERLGRATTLLGRQAAETAQQQVIEEICNAAERLAQRKDGALIVLERTDNLDEYISTGIALNSIVTPQLLLTIFWKNTELHDGAVILRNSQIAAASCVLPLSSGREHSERKIGTRHRAALGISEVSDAICVVVSEETGQISVTNRGRMIRRLDSNRLRTILTAFYGEKRRSQNRFQLRLPRLRNFSLPRWTREQ